MRLSSLERGLAKGILTSVGGTKVLAIPIAEASPTLPGKMATHDASIAEFGQPGTGTGITTATGADRTRVAALNMTELDVEVVPDRWLVNCPVRDERKGPDHQATPV